MKRRPPARQPGFTLIEVLAALVIVALGMLGAIEAVNQSTRNATYLREKTLAHWIAMNLITERRLQPEPPPPDEQQGDVDFAGERWHWTQRVTQTAVQSMRRMDIAVRRASAPDGTSLANVSGFYGTAVGTVGGGSLSWADSGQSGSGGNGEDNRNDNVDPGRNQGQKTPRRPPADTAE
ncbi:MAG TPA: type II secretion system minor pseudopilin GspI [Steroidobacteraceae bacterium]